MNYQPAAVKVRVWRRQRRLTAEQVDRVRALPWERGSGRALARELGVSEPLIHYIRYGLAYKRRDQPQQTYIARATDGGARYSLGSYLTPEAAQNALDKFQRRQKWPRGSVERVKGGRYRARLSLGVYDTQWEADRANAAAIARLNDSRFFR